MSAPVWIPDSARRALDAERQAEEAELLQQYELKGALDHFNDELKQIDPYLELVQAKPNSTHPGLVPGCFYVLRHNPGASPSLIALVDEDDNPVPPDSGVFEMLQKQDLWNGKDRERAARKAQAAAERERNRERERAELRAELATRLGSLNRESVLFSPDVKYRAKPRKRAA